MRDDARHFLGGDEFLLDLEKFLVRLGGLDGDELESSFHIVEHSVAIHRCFGIEAFLRFPERHDIHESGREARIRSDGSVDLNETLHADHLNLSSIQSEFETISQDEDDGKTLTKFVRSGTGSAHPGTSHLVQHHMFGRIDALQMFLGSSWLLVFESDVSVEVLE